MINTQQNYQTNNEVFDFNKIMGIIGQTAQLIQRNAESTSVMMERLERTENLLGGISTRVNTFGDSLTIVEDKVGVLELSEEITTFQNENITTAVKRRIYEIIGDKPLDMEKYSKIFYLRLYSDARKNANMGSKVSRTRKRDYQRVLDYVEAWTPIGGCAALKSRADANAAARLLARQKGYK